MSIQIADAGKLQAGQVKPVWHFFDRWIFVMMAGLLLVTVLAGFIPSSIEKVAAV